MTTNNVINSGQTLSSSSSPTFTGLNLSGLTASRLIATDGSKNFTSTTSSLSPTFTGLTLSGTMVNTGQPAFGANNGSSRNDVTGDGTVYTLIFNSEKFDQANNFDGTSTFTAPVSGKYHFTFSVLAGQIGSSHTQFILALVTTGGTYEMIAGNAANLRDSNSNIIVNGSATVSMNATDTATCTITISGSTKTVDIGAGNFTYFSGFLVC